MAVIRNVGTPSRGVKKLSQLVDPSGTADQLTTLVTIDDNAVLDEWQNNGVPVHRLKGDGRAWFSILPGTPTSPVVGDLWLQDNLGTTEVHFQGAGGETVLASSAGNLEVVASAALLQGHALRADATGLLYAVAVVDVAHKFRVAGILADDTAMGDDGVVLTAGDYLTLADWSLLTGAAALTEGADYWLSATPGRYTTTPHVDVAARVGRAMTATTMLIKPDLVVVS